MSGTAELPHLNRQIMHPNVHRKRDILSSYMWDFVGQGETERPWHLSLCIFSGLNTMGLVFYSMILLRNCYLAIVDFQYRGGDT